MTIAVDLGRKATNQTHKQKAGIAPFETEESCFIASSVTKTWLAHKVASAFPGIFIKLCSVHVRNISEI